MCVCGLPHGGGQTLSVRRCCRCPGAGPGVSPLPVPATIPRSGGSAAAGAVMEGTAAEHPREHHAAGHNPGRWARLVPFPGAGQRGWCGACGPPPAPQLRPSVSAAPRAEPPSAAPLRQRSPARIPEAASPFREAVTSPRHPSLARCRALYRAAGRAREQRRDINRRVTDWLRRRRSWSPGLFRSAHMEQPLDVPLAPLSCTRSAFQRDEPAAGRDKQGSVDVPLAQLSCTRDGEVSATVTDEKCGFLPLQEHFFPTPFFSAVLCATLLNLLPITEDYLKKQVRIYNAFLNSYHM
ncbi:uncharacterized protein [Agelaius tricolor]|uniref:uncharacterized protein n=1 Tax=Agelaius tricolor TaxID=9191 RepID=UPI0039F22422